MPFAIPQPLNKFNRQLAIFPARTWQEPREGRQIIPLELDWPGDGSGFDIDIQQRTTQQFSQIVMLDVDNTASGADATFWFPDTQDTLTVPAYSAGTFPVFTNGLGFYATAPAALASDITRVRVLNFRQEPLANPGPQFHNVDASGAIAVVADTTQILPPTVNGTLIGYDGFASLNGGAAGGTVSFTLQDHTAASRIDLSLVSLPGNGQFNGFVAQASGFAYRFAGGIDLIIGGALGNITGAICVNLKFRSP